MTVKDYGKFGKWSPETLAAQSKLVRELSYYEIKLPKAVMDIVEEIQGRINRIQNTKLKSLTILKLNNLNNELESLKKNNVKLVEMQKDIFNKLKVKPVHRLYRYLI